MDDLIHARCRRVVLDRVMDGRFDRSECEPGEEVCDMCEQRSQAHRVQQSREVFLSRLGDEDRDQLAVSAESGFEQGQRQQDWIDFHMREKVREEACEVEELERQLQRFQHKCAWCFVHGLTESSRHALEDCSVSGASAVRDSCQEFIRSVQQHRSMGEYSCCFYCYVPQAIC